MMIFSSERSDSLCQLGAGCSFCTLLGFILLACGYFSVDVCVRLPFLSACLH